MTPHVPAALDTVLTRALDGAYLSAGQFADELRRVEAARRAAPPRLALTVVALATLVLVAIVVASCRVRSH